MAGQTTSISGIVYAPNGIDPLPNVMVYVPNAPVDAFTPGVSCPVVGQPPSGTPLIGASTAVDGTFTLPNAPVGANIPLVLVSGRWRRQLTIPTVSSCVDNPLPSAPALGAVSPFARFPRNQTEGDIPRVALATGFADPVECALRKVGIDDSEFTDPTGTGRINFYLGNGSATSHGSYIDSGTPSATQLMGDSTVLNQYDLLMLPCEGHSFPRGAGQLTNLVSFANAGGRVYSSHFSYAWMWKNSPFDTVANWIGDQGPSPADGTLASVNASFSGGQTLSAWLKNVGASTTPGKIPLLQIRHDVNGVNPPTEAWLTLDVTGNPVMQFVFDTPVQPSGTVGNQCGRILYNEYHVETQALGSGPFPKNCGTGTSMTAQEKLLEYSLFELTNDGGAATLSPTTADFGSVAVGFTSPTQMFTWTNNSTFPASVTLLNASGDFTPVSNNCAHVPAYGKCQIQVVFSPTALGARVGILTAGSSGTTLSASLTGTGIPPLNLSTTSLSFGNVDVGATATQTLQVINSAPGPVPVPPFVSTGDYSVTNNCGSVLATGGSCVLTVSFKPTTTGVRPGTLAVNSAGAGTPTILTGNGVDFTITVAPTSGTVIAGFGTSIAATTTPLAGFSANLRLQCTTNAPGSLCTLSSTGFVPTVAVLTTATITTTSQYTVIGYGGLGGNGWMALVGLGTGMVLWMRRRSAGTVRRSVLILVMFALALGTAGVGLMGCSGLLPAKNPVYTLATGSPGAPSGPYTYTISATDGFLTHSATYTMTVTTK